MGMRAELEQTSASIIDKEGHDSSRESKETIPWDKKFYVLYTLAVREQKVGKLYGTLPTLLFFVLTLALTHLFLTLILIYS